MPMLSDYSKFKERHWSYPGHLPESITPGLVRLIVPASYYMVLSPRVDTRGYR